MADEDNNMAMNGMMFECWDYHGKGWLAGAGWDWDWIGWRTNWIYAALYVVVSSNAVALFFVFSLSRRLAPLLSFYFLSFVVDMVWFFFMFSKCRAPAIITILFPWTLISSSISSLLFIHFLEVLID
jgi:hypothetical protein